MNIPNANRYKTQHSSASTRANNNSTNNPANNHTGNTPSGNDSSDFWTVIFLIIAAFLALIFLGKFVVYLIGLIVPILAVVGMVILVLAVF